MRRLLPAAVLTAIFGAFAPAGAVADPAPVAKVLATTLTQLKAKTSVPILLPSSFPVETAAGGRLYPDVTVDGKRWDVDLGFVKGCFGANACTAAYLSGQQTSRTTSSADGVKVKLRGGLTGRFRALSCGAGCSPASITFRAHGTTFVYQPKLALKKGQTDRSVLIAIADSALAGGLR